MSGIDSQKSTKLKKYECVTCQKTFTNNRNLRVHNTGRSHILKSQNPNYMVVSSDTNYYECECGAKYQGKSYKSHIAGNKHKQIMELLEYKKLYNSTTAPITT